VTHHPCGTGTPGLGRFRRIRRLGLTLAALLIILSPLAAVVPERAVAVTFDDLPAVRMRHLSNAMSLTETLVGRITALGIPAVGFVTGGKLAEVDGQEELRAGLLDTWLAHGLELGNHTWSHAWFWRTPLDSMMAEVRRTDALVQPLCEGRGLPLRWFRHPMLNTGPDRATKAAFEDFLAEQGCRVAPVTFDSDEYIHARAYDLARESGDTRLQQRIAADYLRYMAEIVAHFEELSRRLLGREPAQVLLLHANWLNAEHLDELAGMLQERGYRFVPLEEALADPAYGLPDEYIGARGMSWLERWALTQGLDPGAMPEAPRWVRRAAGL